MSVGAGEFYALLGPNGAGKATTLRMTTGLLRADRVTISIFGMDPQIDPLAAKRMTAWLPDEPMIYDKLTTREYIEFVAGMWPVELRLAMERADAHLHLLEPWDHRNERCEGLFRGMKQKTALAGALIHEPRLLILDEPLTGLDAVMAKQVKELFAGRVKDGATVVLTTHVLEIAERLAGRIGIINNGCLVIEGKLDQLRARTGLSGSTLEDVFLRLTAGNIGHPRLFVGTSHRNASIALKDKGGRTRLLLSVSAAGKPRIEFLDRAGKVTRTIEPDVTGQADGRG